MPPSRSRGTARAVPPTAAARTRYRWRGAASRRAAALTAPAPARSTGGPVGPCGRLPRPSGFAERGVAERRAPGRTAHVRDASAPPPPRTQRPTPVPAPGGLPPASTSQVSQQSQPGCRRCSRRTANTDRRLAIAFVARVPLLQERCTSPRARRTAGRPYAQGPQQPTTADRPAPGSPTAIGIGSSRAGPEQHAAMHPALPACARRGCSARGRRDIRAAARPGRRPCRCSRLRGCHRAPATGSCRSAAAPGTAAWPSKNREAKSRR